MFTSDGAFHFDFFRRQWIDAVSGRWTPEVYVYAHVVQGGFKIMESIDDEGGEIEHDHTLGTAIGRPPEGPPFA
jgi:hypothetical protein